MSGLILLKFMAGFFVIFSPDIYVGVNFVKIYGGILPLKKGTGGVELGQVRRRWRALYVWPQEYRRG
jgi:hypothetical protein